MTERQLTEEVRALIIAYEQANKCVLSELNVSTDKQRYTDGESIIVKRSITIKIDEQY